mmetsp:Transcript_23574/g.65417  ORF Transcript_23574/g.65417 Transcript_23574/m.65417 type:complete len:239 (-) Transcript_23574:2081-2797(-)
MEFFGGFGKDFETGRGCCLFGRVLRRQKRSAQRFDVAGGQAMDAPATQFGAVVASERRSQVIHNRKRNRQSVVATAAAAILFTFERARADRIIPGRDRRQEANQPLQRDGLARRKVAQEIHDRSALGVHHRLKEFAAALRLGGQQLQNGTLPGIGADFGERVQDLAALHDSAKIDSLPHDLSDGPRDSRVDAHLLRSADSVIGLQHVQNKVHGIGSIVNDKSQRISRLVLPALVVGKS